MTPSLDRLPFDILFYIASSLHLDDVVHLSQTCHQLKALLDERTLYRSVVETFPHTEEARLARAGHVTYKQTHQAIYDRRNALSSAHPFSARVLGQGHAFLYRQGMVCIQTGDIVRISDVRSSDTVQLNLTAIIQPMLESAFAESSCFKLSLMYYSDGILAVYAEAESLTNSGHLFVISTTKDPGRVVKAFRIVTSSKLFVRHNSQYLYYGTHTGVGDDGHHKWEISGVSLDEQLPLIDSKRPLLFEDFHGTDIGSTVAFEIHNDYFYAVSNQGTFQVEEVDWTSFYHCVKFPLYNPVDVEMEKDKCVYRRQHVQGPIHDSWTDLSLQLSERTNEVMIVESRREWARASSRQSRTFYTSKFKVKPKCSSGESSPSKNASETFLLPENDLFVDVLDSTNKPNWMPTPLQHTSSRHPEFSLDVTSPRTFMLARTKFRAYNYSCTSFLDLVEDDRCCNDPSLPPCLRIRVGSRREASLNIPPLNSKGKGRADEAEPTFDDFTQYQNSPIRMWPPPASRCPCSKRLHNILNPPLASGPSHSRTVIGVLDERTLVYMVKPGRSYNPSDDSALGTVVVVDFTRPWKETDSTPTPLLHKTDAGNSVEDDGNASCWQWNLGQNRLCKTGMCH